MGPSSFKPAITHPQSILKRGRGGGRGRERGSEGVKGRDDDEEVTLNSFPS